MLLRSAKVGVKTRLRHAVCRRPGPSASACRQHTRDALVMQTFKHGPRLLQMLLAALGTTPARAVASPACPGGERCAHPQRFATGANLSPQLLKAGEHSSLGRNVHSVSRYVQIKQFVNFEKQKSPLARALAWRSATGQNGMSSSMSSKPLDAAGRAAAAGAAAGRWAGAAGRL